MAEGTRRAPRGGGRSPHRIGVAAAIVLVAAGTASAAWAVSSSAPAGVPARAASPSPGPARPAGAPRAVTATDWTTYQGSGARTGNDTSGASFTPAQAAWTSPSVDGAVYGQPLIAGGRVFVATENDTVYAFAADSGTQLWSTHVGTPFSPSSVLNLCGNIGPTVGITSTPVIDPTRNELFTVAAEQSGPSNASHHLIGVDLFTGAIELDQVISPNPTYEAYQLQRASLALTAGRVVVGFGGNDGDCGPYHGFVVSVPENGGSPSTFEVDSGSGENQGAVWMGGAAPSIDAGGNVWIATGNGSNTGSGDPYDDSDGVLELSPTMQLLQYFAPSTWYSDNGGDADLGSTSPLILGNGLVFQIGKSQTAYLLDQAALGGIGGQSASAPLCSGYADGGEALVGSTVYVPCENGVTSITVSTSPAGIHQNWVTSTGVHGPAVVAGGFVWSESGGGQLEKLSPSTGASVQSFSIGSVATSFPSLAAADGLVVAVGGSSVHAFDGPGGLPGPPAPPPSRPGYWLVASDGGIFSFGSAAFHGSMGGSHLNQPIVGMAAKADGSGYWLVAGDGGIFSFGTAGFHGSMGGSHLNQPVVGMAAMPDGSGYWLVASDGGIFSFGTAGFHGSMGGTRLNQPIVGMAATSDGQGYWLVASDGGIFAFGDASFHGSTGSLHLSAPIVGMAPSPGGKGYWLVAADGGIFAFGDAAFGGSAAPSPGPVAGMVAAPSGVAGYWIFQASGAVSPFGGAPNLGGLTGLAAPIVGGAASPPA